MLDASGADAAERIVNLAMYLAAARRPVSWEDIRVDVAGYPSDQSREAFLRMFERDKKQLRESGLVITSDAGGRYLLDEAATFTTELSLTAEESAALHAAAAAFLTDPAFPFADDLRLALAKLSSRGEVGPQAAARIADESPERQGRYAALVAEAVQRCKLVTFDYTTSTGVTGRRHVEPYGAFVREGRWYLVGRDTDRDAVRTFSLSRARDLEVNRSREATPDFERPEGFDVAAYVVFPFQMGQDEFEAVLEFDRELAWRAAPLVAGHGTLEESADGAVRWSVRAANRDRLARWAIEHGPGIRVVSPRDVVMLADATLEEVYRAHAEHR